MGVSEEHRERGNEREILGASWDHWIMTVCFVCYTFSHKAASLSPPVRPSSPSPSLSCTPRPPLSLSPSLSLSLSLSVIGTRASRLQLAFPGERASGPGRAPLPRRCLAWQSQTRQWAVNGANRLINAQHTQKTTKRKSDGREKRDVSVI